MQIFAIDGVGFASRCSGFVLKNRPASYSFSYNGKFPFVVGKYRREAILPSLIFNMLDLSITYVICCLRLNYIRTRRFHVQFNQNNLGFSLASAYLFAINSFDATKVSIHNIAFAARLTSSAKKILPAI